MAESDGKKWYSGITRYQWVILIIACAGWVFDVYEGQIFNLTRGEMLNDLLSGITDDKARAAKVEMWGDWFLAAFLLGGTAGGLLFGSLADRYGRRPIMIATILTYSLFSGLTYFATDLWQIASLRFFVAMGVGGEWAVAASLVAEIFPKHARTHAASIFHASSVVGTWMAALAGMAVGAQWRYAYLIGIIPALLVVWVRVAVKAPERWKKAADDSRKNAGSYRELFSHSKWRKHALFGMMLAAVGLASFWAVGIATQGLAKEMLLAEGASVAEAAKQSKFAYGIVQTAGAGIGLLLFGPICARIGRHKAFILGHLGAFLVVPVICFLPQTYNQLLWLLPVFGFFTLCMHAGYAVYFPELFPNHLRATGTSFCFNVGRIVAAPMLILSGIVKSIEGFPIRDALSLLGITFLFGLVAIAYLPETKGKELPE